MDSAGVTVQSITVRIQRANGVHKKNVALRRETLQKLIDLTHSSSPELKIVAAANIPSFFQDFPDLEEGAINAVYDVCEDQDPKVRVEGYKAIAEISRAENKLVKRNADVLVQLLQSDEPEEVSVVKNALIEHIEMNSAVTLGVLCDQLGPIDTSADEEERQIRQRLQALVLSFLIDDAIPRLKIADVERIKDDLVIALRSLQSTSDKGEVLVSILLERASSYIREDKAEKPATLATSRPFLELARRLAVEDRIASPVCLLRYYCTSLIGKIFLQQLAPSAQLWVVTNLADILSSPYAGSRNSNFLLHQHKVVEAAPSLLKVLFPTLSEKRTSDSCIHILRVCLLRKTSQDWVASSSLSNVLLELKALTEKLPAQENKREIQKLIMFLVPSSLKQETTQSNRTNLRNADVHQPSKRPLQQPPNIPDVRAPLAKKRRSNGLNPREEPSQGSSLLSRLQLDSRETATSRQNQGLSIKGAAMTTSIGPGVADQRSSHKPVSQSLLARMRDVNVSADQSGATSHPRKRRRGKGMSHGFTAVT